MPASKIRFVTACQQVLALGAVLAVLTPAANVISLDVVHDRQEQGFVAPVAHHRDHRGDDRCASRHQARRVPGADRAAHAEHAKSRC